jgi:hypothetical protein
MSTPKSPKAPRTPKSPKKSKEPQKSTSNPKADNNDLMLAFFPQLSMLLKDSRVSKEKTKPLIVNKEVEMNGRQYKLGSSIQEIEKAWIARFELTTDGLHEVFHVHLNKDGGDHSTSLSDHLARGLGVAKEEIQDPIVLEAVVAAATSVLKMKRQLDVDTAPAKSPKRAKGKQTKGTAVKCSVNGCTSNAENDGSHPGWCGTHFAMMQ